MNRASVLLALVLFYHIITHLSFLASAEPTERVDVVIIGAGASGLTAAKEFSDENIFYTVLEASPRVGGRIRTDPFPFGLNIISNAGAELIDSTHCDAISLIKGLGCELVERPRNGLDIFEIKGQFYNWADLTKEIFTTELNALSKIQQIISAAQSSSLEHRELDEKSAASVLLLIENAPLLKGLIETFLLSEYGLPLSQLSGAILSEVIHIDMEGKRIGLLPQNDERYIVKGGTQTFIDRLSDRLGKQIRLNHQVTDITENSDGSFLVRYENGGIIKDIQTKILVSSVPSFQFVNINLHGESFNGIKVEKAKQFASNGKLILYFSKRIWEDYNISGNGMLEMFSAQMWDSSVLQDTSFGSLTLYFSDKILDTNSDDEILLLSKRILIELEKVIPGISQHFIHARYYSWPSSYSDAPRPGEKMLQKNVVSRTGRFFRIGEEYDDLSQGYVNGAVRSAKTVVKNVLNSLSLHKGPSCRSAIGVEIH